MRYARRRKAKRRFIVALIIIAVICTAIGIYVQKNVNPVIISFCKETMQQTAYTSINSAVKDVMSHNDSADLVTIQYDKEGKIRYVGANTAKIGVITNEITLLTQEKVNSQSINGIKIPIGSLSGMTILTGLGPDFNVKVFSVGAVRSYVRSVFSTAGINQTSHKVFLGVTTSIALAIPGVNSSVTADSEVLISETIIVGDVPQTFLSATDIGDMLNLIAA